MIGTDIGPYRVVDRLGAGGMGEVYLAHDAKLNRDVALKLLPNSLAHDPDRLARLRREAQVLAALNHTNIAHIYGLEDSTDHPALVMELVGGRTLAEVIADGPMRWQEAVPIARQIAEALEAAHERGIVHRDLKPANIKVRDDGVVKVLDFGLAKAMEATDPGLPRSGSNSPTISSPARLGGGAGEGGTEAGIIMGTAAYMSPEQAKGRGVDKRSDIWAFGVVTAEMLIGGPLFAGESMAETIAAVIKEDPRLDRLPAETPAPVRHLLARCLERDPKQRLRDIGEARILLSNPIDANRDHPALPPPSQRGRWGMAILGAVALAAIAGIVGWSLKPAPSAPLRRFELPASLGEASDFAIAHDGSRLAYLLGSHLFVRRFDELEAKDLGLMPPATSQLVWSPDDGTIGFSAEASIQSIPADGGPRFVIGKIPASGRAMGITWLRSGKILFSVWRDSLYEVASTGGTPVVRLAIDEANEIDFHHVAALPDDRLVITTHKRKEDSDIVELVDGQRRTMLTTDRSVSWFEYVAPAMLVFRRTATNIGIWAVPFTGGPIDVNAATLVQPGATSYRVGGDGTIVALIPAISKAALVWVDRTGVETIVPGPILESPENDLKLSPDGRRAAFVQGRRLEAGGGLGSTTAASILVRDLQLGVDTRLTVPPADAGMWTDAGMPTWFPDGSRLLHRTGGTETLKLVERRADAAGDANVLTPGLVGCILPDARTLIYVRDERGRGRLRSATVAAGGVVDDKALFDVESQPNVRGLDVSRDGRLIAYQVTQSSGRSDIYLTSLADVRAQRLVQEGGTRPRFAGDNQLFFATGTLDEQQPRGRLMRVSVTAGSSISVGPPTEVLREAPNGPRLTTYDVSSDGDRFLMWKTVPAASGERQRFVLVQNALRRASQ